MNNGLWITPTNFLSFAAADEQRLQDLQGEMYAPSTAGGFDPLGWLGILPDPDPVLRKTGDSVSVLRSLTADDKVLSCMQNRKLGTLKKRDWVLDAGHLDDREPDAAAQRLRDALQRDLQGVNLYNVFSQVLDAPYYGATHVEIIWERADGRMHIKDLKPRPPEWFGYTSDGDLRFCSLGEVEGEPVPEDKVVSARHFPDATNPYGLRLLSRCLWPVAIKKGGIQFWTTLAERFGIPWVIGRATTDDPGERGRIAAALAAMVQDAVAVVSRGTEVDVHSQSGSVGQLHGDLVTYMDTAIARVLHGQSINNEGRSTGTYAEGKVSYDALGDYREADETLLVTFMDELSWTYAKMNDQNALSPSFRFVEPEDYQTQAELDKKLHGVGVRFTKKHFSRRYNLAADEFDVSAERPGNAGSDFAAPAESFDEDQQAVEDMLAGISDELAGLLEGNERLILETIESSRSYEEAMERLLELWPRLGIDELQKLLSRCLVAADCYGRRTVREADDD